MFGLFRKKTNYIQSLLATKSPEKFIAGISQNPKDFFNEASKDHKSALRALAMVLEMAGHSLGQTALLLSIIGTLKTASKDARAPKTAAKTAESLTADLQRIMKMAG